MFQLRCFGWHRSIKMDMQTSLLECSLLPHCHAGEPLPLELVELIYRNVPKGVVVYNTYGGYLLLLSAEAGLA